MARCQSILVVEDETAAREHLRFMLEDAGFDVVGAADAREARGFISDPANGFDMVLLDVGLPDGNGRDVCTWIRREGFTMPVVMLTGHGEQKDVLSGLDSGASDYVPKPYRTGELVARIRAHLRAYDMSEDAPFHAGFWEVRPTRRVMVDRRDGRVVRITDREMRMLRLISKGFPSATSRADLLENVWGYSASMHTHTVETHVYRLRQKIEPVPSRPSVLITEGQGYRLAPHPPAPRPGELVAAG